MNVVKTNKAEVLKEIDEKIDKEICSIPDNAEIGFISNFATRECENKETHQKFTLIDVEVKNKRGKRFIKTFSVDFARKYFGQMGYKVKDLVDCVVFFTRGEYSNIRSFFPVVWENLDDNENPYYDIFRYNNEEARDYSIFDKLGI